MLEELGKENEVQQPFLAMITGQEAAGVFTSAAQVLKPHLDQFNPHGLMSNADSIIHGTYGTTGMTSSVLPRAVQTWSTARV